MRADAQVTAAPSPDDDAALLLMLAYIEAECRRLGAEAAAVHVAMAAALVPSAQPQAGTRRIH